MPAAANPRTLRTGNDNLGIIKRNSKRSLSSAAVFPSVTASKYRIPVSRRSGILVELPFLGVPKLHERHPKTRRFSGPSRRERNLLLPYRLALPRRRSRRRRPAAWGLSRNYCNRHRELRPVLCRDFPDWILAQVHSRLLVGGVKRPTKSSPAPARANRPYQGRGAYAQSATG